MEGTWIRAEDGAGIDWDELSWVAPPLGGRGIVVCEKVGRKRVGGACDWCLGEKKSEQNESNSNSSYARPRSNQRMETDETTAVQWTMLDDWGLSRQEDETL